MKKQCCLIIAFVVIFGIFGGANAALVPYGTDAIKDTTTGLLWWKNLSVFSDKTYDQQVDYIATELGGGWHMATQAEMCGLFPWMSTIELERVVELETMFIPVTENGKRYYNGRYGLQVEEDTHDDITLHVTDDPSYAYIFSFCGHHTDDSYSDLSFGAWVCTTVPIPSAVWLLGSGLIGIVGIRRKIKK